MTRMFWRDGRLPWPIAAVLAYLAISVVAGDLAWRVLVMPFESFLLYGLLIEVLAAAVALAAWRIVRRQA